MPSRISLYLTLFCLGVLAQVAQAQLVRELLVVFYGNEVGMGAFFASWLFWVGIGSLAVIPAGVSGSGERQHTLLVCILAALPWLLALQVLAVRVSRGFMETSSVELLGLGDLLLATFLVSLPTGIALGGAFPLACRLLAAGDSRPVGAVSRLYVLDALGAFGGGLLFTFVLIEWLGVWPSLGVSALLVTGAAWTLGPASARLRGILAFTGLAGALLLIPPLVGPLSRAAEQLRFSTIHPGLQLLETTETRYGHVAVARLGEQYSVVRDGRVADSFPDPKPIAQSAAFFQAEASGARRILMIGGPSLELATELLRYPVDRLDLVLDDRRAFEQIRPYFGPDVQLALADPRLRLHFQDGRRFVNALAADAAYDLVLALGVDPSSAHQNRYFTRELYARALRAMALSGVLCTSVDSASNYLGREVQGYGAAVLHTLEAVFGEVIVVPGDHQLMCGAQGTGQVSVDPDRMAERYAAIPLADRRFPGEGFSLMLEPERVAFVRERLEQGDRVINTDLRPVTYYLNMVLWGKFTASAFVGLLHALGRLGIWPYLVPLALFAGLMLLRQALEDSPMHTRRSQSGTLALWRCWGSSPWPPSSS